MTAISPHIQPSAPAFSLATLRTVLAELEAAEPERCQRWLRAATIVALRRIEPTANGNYWVQSEADPTAEYFVCHLPDSTSGCATARTSSSAAAPASMDSPCGCC